MKTLFNRLRVYVLADKVFAAVIALAILLLLVGYPLLGALVAVVFVLYRTGQLKPLLDRLKSRLGL